MNVSNTLINISSAQTACVQGMIVIHVNAVIVDNATWLIQLCCMMIRKPEVMCSTSAVAVSAAESSPITDVSSTNSMITMISSFTVESEFKNTCHILPTAIIFVYDFFSFGHPHKCTALIDPGSQRSYMMISLCT